MNCFACRRQHDSYPSQDIHPNTIRARYHQSIAFSIISAYLGPKATTPDGFDYCFQVNFLSHFYLTHLVIRHLSSTNSPSSIHPIRVINVSSDSYVMGDADFKDVTLDDDNSRYDIYQAYATSKLAMILFTKQLMSRYSAAGVKAVAVHPGT